MDIRKLQRAIVDGLEDVKAQNIVVFNTEHLSPLFERVIIASGTSNRQTKALASSVRQTVKGQGLEVLRTEGEENGEWIIVDCGAAVVHVMQPGIRDYYHLEEIWGGKPVKIKLGSSEVKLVKASEDASAKPAKVAAKKPAAKPLGPVLGRKTAPAKKAAAPAAKQAAAKLPAKKAPHRVADTKAPASKTLTVGAGKPAAKKPAAKKAAVKTTVGVKKAAPAVKAAARKPAARKAAPNKAAPKKA